MAYAPNQNWDSMEKSLSDKAVKLVDALNECRNEYDEWSQYQTWSANMGNTNFSSIAVALGVPQTYVNDYHMTLSRMKECYDFMTGTSGLAAVDRLYDVRSFI